ncbi:MAG: GNAT family N-acetyltransferase [Chloroflexota bacterium]
MIEGFIRDLGDGLVLRCSTEKDTEALVEFHSRIHSDAGLDNPDEYVAAWTRDLMTRPHPTFHVGDFTIVEDTVSRKIVSSLNLISQTWAYDGIEFEVGRPELVGTHPEYRKRGLIRAQFEVIHEWGEQRGHKLQVITGIPYFYRQFGYEMALPLGGGRIGYPHNVPMLGANEQEPYCIRPATEDDIPFLAQVYDVARARSLVSCVRDEGLWRYELCGRSEKNVNRAEIRVVETPEGTPAGFFVHSTFLEEGKLLVFMYELNPGVSWLDVTPSLLRYLKETGEEYGRRKDRKQTFSNYYLNLGNEHPVYHVIPSLLPHKRPSYAWYLRVADLPDFLGHISPVLEQRLADSLVVGYSGELRLNLYRRGINLIFEKGKLEEMDTWTPKSDEEGDVLFPGLTFLQSLFGYRSLNELRDSYPDCFPRNDKGRILIETLFPKRLSYVWAVT